MRGVFGAALLLFTCAVPSEAQPGPSSATTPAAVDGARIAAARPVIDRIWPLGTYRKMMDGMAGGVMDAILTQSFGMKAKDIAGMSGDPKAAAAAGDETVGDLAAKADPAFRERMQITMDVMMREMAGLMSAVEPQVRDALARSYARRFTVDQLTDLARFFATPTGAAYAEQSMLVYADPEMIGAMQSFTPLMLKAMPDIMKKVEAATSHLPPPPKRPQP